MTMAALTLASAGCGPGTIFELTSPAPTVPLDIDDSPHEFGGDDVYVPFRTTGRAFYYSRPTMRSVGTLTVNGTTHQVDREFWFDRQLAMQVTNPWAEWDWFSLRLDIPSHEPKMTVGATVEDQELDVRASTFNVYWEGLCDIGGTRSGQPIAGHAYVELTKYP